MDSRKRSARQSTQESKADVPRTKDVSTDGPHSSQDKSTSGGTGHAKGSVVQFNAEQLHTGLQTKSSDGQPYCVDPYDFRNIRSALPEVSDGISATQYSAEYTKYGDLSLQSDLVDSMRDSEQQDEAIKLLPKSISPPHSSAPTTGTTTTPTSLNNYCSNSPEYLSRVSSLQKQSQEVRSCPVSPRQTLAQPLYMREFSASSPHLPSMDQSSPTLPVQKHSSIDYSAAIKLLVSNNVAGSIIGRAGQTISEMQLQSQTRIKLSQTGDFYPGTQDRVCLIQGQAENIKVALYLLLEKLYFLQEHQHSQHVTWQLQKQMGQTAPAFDFIVKVLVPSSCCGMIIGKSGSNIKYMEETTGVASVRLSPRENNSLPGIYYRQPSGVNVTTSERAVTVTGSTLNSCLQCLYLIFDGMTTHPEISRYTNMTTSYSRIVPDQAPPVYHHALPTAIQQQQHPMLAATAALPALLPSMALNLACPPSPHQMPHHHHLSHSTHQLHLHHPPAHSPHQLHPHQLSPSAHNFPPSPHLTSPDRHLFWDQPPIYD